MNHFLSYRECRDEDKIVRKQCDNKDQRWNDSQVGQVNLWFVYANDECLLKILVLTLHCRENEDDSGRENYEVNSIFFR